MQQQSKLPEGLKTWIGALACCRVPWQNKSDAEGILVHISEIWNKIQYFPYSISGYSFNPSSNDTGSIRALMEIRRRGIFRNRRCLVHC